MKPSAPLDRGREGWVLGLLKKSPNDDAPQVHQPARGDGRLKDTRLVILPLPVGA